jgi:hypothetical protein
MSLMLQITKRIRRIGLAVGVALMVWNTSSPAEAHFPHFRHHAHFGYYGPRHFSYYGPGFAYYGGYRPFLHRSYAVGYFSYPWYYSTYYPLYPTYPLYFAPTYYGYSIPTITWPVTTYYYQPVCTTAPAAGTSSYFVQNATAHNARTRVQSVPDEPQVLRRDETLSVKLASATVPVDVSMPKPRIEELKAESASTITIVRKPVVLKPYSPIWTKAAVGLVDNMIEEGRFEDAVASCKSMEKISEPKGAGVYLRQGITTLFSVRKLDNAMLDRALDHLNDACLSGSQLSPMELDQGSTLTDYFRSCDQVDIQSTLDELSKQILDQPSESFKQLIVLAVLLKLDGQEERASLFAQEALQHPARSNRWTSVLHASIDEPMTR